MDSQLTDCPYDFRIIRPGDLEAIKQLHEECFPIRYSDRFFKDACVGIGFDGGNLFTSLACLRSTGEVVGFIFGQILAEGECGDAGLLDRRIPLSGSGTTGSSSSLGSGGNYNYTNSGNSVTNTTNNNNNGKNSSNRSNTDDVNFVCYILTLGLKKEYRRSGLGSKLLAKCIAYAESNRYCGAVYLHVIHNNPAAIAFYRRHDFIHFRTLSAFYQIGGVNHTAFLYILYINGFQGPLLYRLMTKVQSSLEMVLRASLTWLQTLWQASPDSKALEGGSTPSPSQSLSTDIV